MLHFASVVTLIVAQLVLLGTYFAAVAPRSRVTRVFFQEIHRPVYLQDTEKREALVAQWVNQVRRYSARYAAGLTAYLALMAAFAGTTAAYFWTRRPQDPWWGWLNWLQAWRDARTWLTDRLHGGIPNDVPRRPPGVTPSPERKKRTSFATASSHAAAPRAGVHAGR
ncbi:hypothetical protein DB346_14070 [Verrucomicrobia bacterium LW23]|nr:hypothetical protein DB346_14070 [Verrucomicrobia bacterium LW23]